MRGEIQTFWDSIHSGLELGLVDQLETVGVVVCHLRVVGYLHGKIDAGIDESECVDPQLRAFEAAVGDERVLGLEERGVGGAGRC